ncbi:deoxyribose-phosphate aldolase, partial [Xanthomonas citri pv. citri]|nr:deoxyribose-phosphate aldolase [Xanthomonas citri pv. citri]
ISIKAGADFIKTSTGKVPVNATLESARIMLETIRDLKVADRVGFKAAGGVKTAEEAAQYLALAQEILGHDWVNSDHFRFGASSLLTNLLAELNGQANQKVSGY